MICKQPYEQLTHEQIEQWQQCWLGRSEKHDVPVQAMYERLDAGLVEVP